MTASLRYALIGSGRWGSIIRNVLEGHGAGVCAIAQARQHASEDLPDYSARLQIELAATGADVAWLAVPPGPHVGSMIEAAIAVGLDVVVEKPWLPACGDASALAATACAAGRLVVVDFEYCFLDAMQDWRARFAGGAGLVFEGDFLLSRPDRLGLPAIQNLGSHLVALHRVAVPKAMLGALTCGYAIGDRRAVRLRLGAREVAVVDFTQLREPLIQRFIAAFEGARGAGVFELDLLFANQVYDKLQGLKRAPL